MLFRSNKPTTELTKADILLFAQAHDIRMVDFRYIGGDGKLKTLNFIIPDVDYLDQILSTGERVDGSSLFPNLMYAGSSDLYVIPRFSTAFIDPFNEIPTLSFLCSYFNKDGEPMEISPEQILRKAAVAFRNTTGMEFQAMGELECYVIGESEALYPITDKRGYNESAPFAKFEDFRRQCML